ncbi:MAG TPA: hypothetical protein VGQ37_17460 [Vicinamibacterales bacterium]|jgi:hypothetical protein|nr:hypothetical protein [Vicinamibacterales bacterium]
MSHSTNRIVHVAGVAVIALIIASGTERIVHGQSGTAPGGFVESATGVGLRPTLSAAEIRVFLPSRGTFTFPSPYRTTGVRLSNANDCGGADCVLPVGYSYWSNINNHAGSDTMLIFLGLSRQKGGGGPTLFSFNKRTGEAANLGPLFGADHPLSWSTGEGWYFSATRPSALYLNDGPRLVRYDVSARTFETVFDAAGQFGADKYLWQAHSSADDLVHSATLRQSSTYEMVGCVVYNEATRRTWWFAKKGDFDECQIDRSGRWLVTKENVDGLNGEDNRIIDLQTGTEQLLTDPNGASGHSDLGFGYLIAEDNFNRLPGAVRRWNLSGDMRGGQPATVAGQGELVYQLSSWASGLGHIAFGNARPGQPIEQQRACASNASRQSLPRVNEIVCFRLDGSLDTLVVAPNLTDLNASGGGADDYSKLPKGNIDVTGEYFIWTANAGSSRLDAFLVRVPTMPGTAGGPPPATAPAPPAATPAAPMVAGQAVSWTSLVNVTATATELRKTGGCAGCPDAGAVSSQTIASGDGELSLVAGDTQALRVIGLSSGNAGTGPAEIRFGLRLQDGRVEVREQGAYKAERAIAAGDLLKVTVRAGTVSYSVGGTVFYTSTAAPVYPLLVDTSLFDLGASLSAVTLAHP